MRVLGLLLLALVSAAQADKAATPAKHPPADDERLIGKRDALMR